MAGLTQVGMQKILDTLTGKAAYAIPTLYARLTTTSGTQTSASVIGTELTTGQYGGYAAKVFTGGNWSVATAGGACTYSTAIDFGAASASTTATVNGVEIWDASSGGNRLWWETLTNISVSTGTHISFAGGQFVATIPVLAAGVGFSQAYVKLMVEHMVGKTAFGAAPLHWLALGTSACSVSAIGTEVAYTGYARVQMPFANVNVATVVGGNVDVVLNAQENFGADTAGSATATFFYVMDASSSGNLIAGGTVTGGAITSGVTPDFPVGSTIYRLN